MKKSELKQMIREEIQKINEGAKVKLNYSKIKKWAEELDYSYWGKEYPPEQWHVDDFKNYIRDALYLGGGKVNSKIANIFGLPTNEPYQFLNDNGSGLNNDQNFKKYKTWFAALYDIWEDIQKKFNWKSNSKY